MTMSMIFNDAEFFPINSAARDRIDELETALTQAVMELREASNICTSCDMPGTANIFAKAAARKAELLESGHV